LIIRSKYNSKELEGEQVLYWFQYGFRYHEPQLGGWLAMGPADEFHSPYIYVGNNPMKLIKPDGVKVLMSTKLWSNTTFRNDAINSKQFQSQASLRGKGGSI
jgi:RHS repeat-associated protein